MLTFILAATILFDAAHAQTAGNADWVLDEDRCGIAQRQPTPDQSRITPSTPETFWSGALSAMGVDLVKKGFRVESLPSGARISYGDKSNAQDLSKYEVFVMPEPNVRLTSKEIDAIRTFVQRGGGLFVIADHAGADRNNDGWDSTEILNELTKSFGIEFNTNAGDRKFGWFNDKAANMATSPITQGATRGLGLFGSTSMTLTANAKGHVWTTRSKRDSGSGAVLATSTFGKGRVAALSDSSVIEDATNSCRHKTHGGWGDARFDNALITVNAIRWLTARSK